MLENVLNLADRHGRVRHRIGLDLLGRRGRRLREEAAEVAAIDLWLATIRSGPEMVLYPAHPAPVRAGGLALAAPTAAPRRAKKRRR